MTNYQLIEISALALIAARLFFSKYFEEKGKNLATKEDLKEITEIAENVKLQLQHTFSQAATWNAEHKTSILNFFDEYSYWINHSIKNMSLTQNYPSDQHKIRETINELNVQTGKVSKSFWRVSIYETDQTFFASITRIYINADNLSNIVVNFLLELELLAINVDAYTKANDISNVKILIKERNNSIDKFVLKRDKLEKIVLTEFIQLKDIIGDKLRSQLK